MGLQNLPLGLKWRSSTSFIITTVAMSLFTDLFLYGLVVPTLPYLLEERLHLPGSQIQSYTSGLLAAYAASSVVFSLPAGYFADLMPTRRLPFLLGLTALFAATAMFAIGQSVWVLVIARVLQGIAAAAVWTIGLSLLYDTVGSANLGKSIGSIFSVISVGELAAPVSGGMLYKTAGIMGVLALGFALLVLDFMMRLAMIEKKVAARYTKGEGPVRQSSGESPEACQEPTEQDPLISKPQSINLHQLPATRSWWLRCFPIIYIFKDVRLPLSMLLTFVQSSLLASFDATSRYCRSLMSLCLGGGCVPKYVSRFMFFINFGEHLLTRDSPLVPTYAKKTFDFDSQSSGLLFIPLVIPYLILGSLFGWVVDRYGTKWPATIGYAYLAPVLVLLRLPHAGGRDQIGLFCAILFLCGLGICVIGSPSLVEASKVVEQYHSADPDFFGAKGPYAQLYALNSMTYSLGMTFGPLLSGFLKESIGYGNANLVLACICLVVSLLSYLYIGGPPQTFSRDSRPDQNVSD